MSRKIKKKVRSVKDDGADEGGHQHANSKTGYKGNNRNEKVSSR